MFWEFGAGVPTLIVNGVEPVRAFRLSVTPGIVCCAP